VYETTGGLSYVTVNGTKYLYEIDAQGDIIGLLDSDGNEVVTYQYDTWGKLINIGGSLASTVGTENPFRYRGYYYDTETGLYYLQSRYYNPEVGRFISKDDESYHIGQTAAAANLYAYCSNNPVNLVDADGHLGTPASIAINIAINLITWAVWKYAIYKNTSWHTGDTIDVISAIVCGIVGWWGSSYLRVKASKFAWGIYLGVKNVIVSWSWNGIPKNKWTAANQISQVLISSLVSAFF